MPFANSHSHALSASPAPVEAVSFFKEDRPRRIDRFISFFGDTDDASEDLCGDALLES
jgi:hypothetical protein